MCTRCRIQYKIRSYAVIVNRTEQNISEVACAQWTQGDVTQEDHTRSPHKDHSMSSPSSTKLFGLPLGGQGALVSELEAQDEGVQPWVHYEFLWTLSSVLERLRAAREGCLSRESSVQMRGVSWLSEQAPRGRKGTCFS